MKDKYLLKAIKEEKLLDKFKDYKKMTREEIEYQLGWGDTNEFSWGFAIYLLNNIDKVIEYIEEKYDYILGNDTFLNHDERIDRKQIKYILEILKGGE